jgi:NADPH:quinone reductase-like Zn-dependent oxidoreductase
MVLPSLFVALAVVFQPAAQPAGTPAPTMKAVRYHQAGGPEVLKYEDVPRPSPGPGEMLIRVAAAGVNPVDAKFRKAGRPSLPFTPGFDVAGAVEEVGPGVSAFKKGDEVFAYIPLARGGGYAQYAIVKEPEAAPKPAKATMAQAAGLPVAALTAWQALFDTAKLEKGQSILIHGGSGGVGTMAVQLAHWKGARVLATASTDNQAFLKQLGADVAIDYKTQKFEDVAKDVDVVLDTVGGDTAARSFGVLKKGGILVSIVGQPPQDKAKAAGVRAAGILVQPSGAQLREIAGLVDSGALKPVVTRELPLQDAAKAHELIESGHTRGKIVLTTSQEHRP